MSTCKLAGYTFIRTQTAVLCPVSDRNRLNQHIYKWKQLLQQSGTSHILLIAIHWFHRLYSAPLWFDRVNIKTSVKADFGLAICLVFLGNARL